MGKYYKEPLPIMDGLEEIETEVQEEKIEPVVYTKVTTSKLRVRKEPNTTAAVLKVLDLGDEVEIIKEEDGWAHLTDGTFCMSEYLK